MSVSLVVGAGLVASQFIVRGNLSSSALGSLTVPESVLNKKDITNDETGNNVDCFNVKKVNLSKKLENDVTIKADPDLNKKAINKGDIKFSKEELDSKELAKRLIIPIFSFANIGVATSFIKHLVDSKNEQQNKKEDDPITEPNPRKDPRNDPKNDSDTVSESKEIKNKKYISVTIFADLILFTLAFYIILGLIFRNTYIFSFHFFWRLRPSPLHVLFFLRAIKIAPTFFIFFVLKSNFLGIL